MQEHPVQPSSGRPVAIVTGASRGIGRAIALELARTGYDLGICCHHNRELLRETAQSAESLGSRSISACGDISDSSFVRHFIGQVQQELGAPDVLINNAGISHVGLFQDMSDEQWDRMIQTNLSSVFYTCRQIIPSMIHRQHGCILNISSVWGNTGASTEVAYSAAKGGVNALTRALAKELAPSHIRVNAIACGFIDTEMNGFLSDEDREALFEEIPAGRAGTVQEVADLVHRILDAPEYLTGQIITMDGGWI